MLPPRPGSSVQSAAAMSPQASPDLKLLKDNNVAYIASFSIHLWGKGVVALLSISHCKVTY